MLIDLGFGEEAASPRLQAIDRAELLASLAALVGAEARRRLGRARARSPTTWPPRLPYLQPLALSAATRKAASKSLLRELRAERRRGHRRTSRCRSSGSSACGPRTLMMIATLTGAFYVLLPQLANVDDSFRALRSANWAVARRRAS